MDISVSEQQGNVPVAVIKVDGQLDGQSYQDLIAKARELYDAGARDFLLDLSNLTYISSAGLVAIHSIALLVKGEELPDPESGRSHHCGPASGEQRHRGCQDTSDCRLDDQAMRDF